MTEPNPDRSDDSEAVTPGGDDEQQHRDKIAKTGEPERDKLGNADGAS